MDEEMVNLTIDGQKICVKKGTTILSATREAGIDMTQSTEPMILIVKAIRR